MRMRLFRLAVLMPVGLVLLTVASALAQSVPHPLPPAPKNWVQAKTPWGDPDIQGTWTSDDCIGTPMNRPANFGERPFYTEEELAQRQKQLDTQQKNDLVETVAP